MEELCSSVAALAVPAPSAHVLLRTVDAVSHSGLNSCGNNTSTFLSCSVLITWVSMAVKI